VRTSTRRLQTWKVEPTRPLVGVPSGPTRVTSSPARMDSIGRAPSGVTTSVPAGKHPGGQGGNCPWRNLLGRGGEGVGGHADSPNTSARQPRDSQRIGLPPTRVVDADGITRL